MGESPRILHIITGLGTGGAEMMLYKVATRLSQLGLPQCVVSLREGGPVSERIRAAGVVVHELGMPRGLPTVSGLLELRRIVRQWRPDRVQGWMYHGNLAAWAATRGTGLPLLWNVRQTLYDLSLERPLSRLVIRANARLSGAARVIVYNSQLSRLQHEGFGFASAGGLFIPNGFDTVAMRADAAARTAWRERLGLPDDALLMGLVARYHPMKNQEGFLRAAARVVAQRPGVHVLLAGRGVDGDNASLREVIATTGLGGQVHLLGEVADIASLHAALDVEVSASHTVEAFSNAIGEAMACAVPCVVTDVGDSAAVVGTTGRVVPPSDEAALAAALQELLALPVPARRALGQQARERIRQHYDLEAVARTYAALYRDPALDTGRVRPCLEGCC
ncbi:MAG: glycosyltransferase [Halothiobacillaceae bacterium]|nr:glycosyltransferase [Halothiobacillaceae bacterium]